MFSESDWKAKRATQDVLVAISLQKTVSIVIFQGVERTPCRREFLVLFAFGFARKREFFTQST